MRDESARLVQKNREAKGEREEVSTEKRIVVSHR
jgi:hypothetical protein